MTSALESDFWSGGCFFAFVKTELNKYNKEKIYIKAGNKMDKEHVFFENYALTWDRDRKENKKVLQELMQLIQVRPGSHVLDVGCGTGVLIPYVQEAVGAEGYVEALDYSKQMLDKAKEKFAQLQHVSFTEGNILKYTLPEQYYDAILCLNFYPHISQHSRDFIKKMHKALKDDGILVIMHDMPRQKVNTIHQDVKGNQPLLPPVDVLEANLISAGFSVQLAMDTESFYLVKVVKRLDMPYIHYQEEEAAETAVPVCCSPHTHLHSHEQTKIVLNRLARVSGHLEAIRRMVEDGRDCSEVLVQLAAVDSAIVSVSKVVLKDHIDHCIVDAVKENDLQSVENLKKAISTFIK